MTIFELWRKGQNKYSTRKYITVARDTNMARVLTATYVKNEEEEQIPPADLEAGYPDEWDMRKRDAPGRWAYGSVWDLCRQKKAKNEEEVIYSYFC